MNELSRKQAALRVRADTLRAVRAFFDAHDFLEVETPVRLPAPALEEHIDAEPAGAAFLRTSPELHMKRLIAAGYDRVFQMGPCFRQGERGTLHHPEYTMLEWYRSPGDYLDILTDTITLVRSVTQTVTGGATILRNGVRVSVEAEWSVLTVQEAFVRWADWDPVAHYDADRFDIDLVERVEPALKQFEVPVVLKDYPLSAAALARPAPNDPRVAERWELYLHGIELANAYSELTDADEQERRFKACAEARRAAGRTVYPLDTAFLRALRKGMPPCGGIALGIDRLVLCLCGAETLADVIAFLE